MCQKPRQIANLTGVQIEILTHIHVCALTMHHLSNTLFVTALFFLDRLNLYGKEKRVKKE